MDVVGEADIVEEILRIYGINNIELSNIAGTDYLSEFPAKDINKFKRSIGEMLVGNGFYEILTNSLTNFAYQQKLKLTFQGEPVEILNKLSEEQGILRQSMLFTGLEVCSHNINRKQKDLKLFEFGKIYWKDTNKLQTENFKFQEEERLAIYLTGNNEAENWQNKTKPTSYYDVAQQVSTILEKCSINNSKQETLENHPLLEYGIRLSQGKTELGIVGKVKPSLAKELGVKQEVFYADLNTAILFRSASPKFRVEEISKFPEVRRDLSLVLDKNVSFAEIKQLINVTEKKFLKDIIVFDVYEGDKIPEGKKAYALGFKLLDSTKTLTDDEIDKVMTKLITAFEQKMGALIRK